MKAALATLGCRVNQYESEAMAEKFIREGYKIVEFNEVADVYVINTCTVTSMGDKKSRQMISKARRLNNEAIIAVVGCYSQMAPMEVGDIKGVDIVLGTRNKGDILYHVNRFKQEGKIIIEVQPVLSNTKFEDLDIEDYQDKTRAFMKIQDGCNRFCSYCMIPYARGAVCSKKPSKIIEEANKLAAHGFKEIILSGIHIASYGIDLEEKIGLIDILEKLDAMEGIERIRIGSIDPQFFTDNVLERLIALKKLCPHFHLSLQSGSDEVLKSMNRRYTSMEYKEIVNKLRDKIKDVSITTDVIVGFPGESQKDFEDCYNFLQDIKLSKLHVFKYSPRKGTKASTMKPQVHGREKDVRSDLLLKLNVECENAFMLKYLGSTLTVLFEEKALGENNIYQGYTENYLRVYAKSDKDISGRILSVKLINIQGEHIFGEIV